MDSNETNVLLNYIVDEIKEIKLSLSKILDNMVSKSDCENRQTICNKNIDSNMEKKTNLSLIK